MPPSTSTWPCRRSACAPTPGLAEEIRAVHAGSKGRYGAPRVHAQLARDGRRHGRKRVARIMRSAGLHGRAARRWKRTTIADPAAAARADKVRRDFTANAAAVNSRWCGDITYVSTWEGWLYLATVIDIASRRVVGYAMADHLRTSLVADALANAVAARDPAPGVIFHADRGCQYTSADFAALAADCQVELSHGRTGQCWDNALAESDHAGGSRKLKPGAKLAYGVLPAQRCDAAAGHRRGYSGKGAGAGAADRCTVPCRCRTRGGPDYQRGQEGSGRHPRTGSC